MLKGKKAVLFDLDGTLVDSMWVWSEVDIRYLGEMGLSVPADLQEEIEGMGFTEVAEYFKKRFQISQDIEQIKETWNILAMDAYQNQVKLKPGIRSFLTYLKSQNIRTAVASSNSWELIEAVLKSHRIDRYFDCIVTSCEVQRGKPAPDVYLEAAGRLGVKPENCLVFEDIVAGIQSGKAAGMTTCAVEDAYSLAQREEKRRRADYYIESYDEVIKEALKEC
ncbi:HAD family hydrolase [Blautia hydrogenotrophica]|uniref:HAD family hydrolase n=1 Tax=Blautia hydrogenotrophica TaxID=53443 RepID=UPI003AB57A16